MAKRGKSGETAKRRGRLALELYDANRGPIRSRCEVVVTPTVKGGKARRAAGKAGEVTRFVFDHIPAGDYRVRVRCEGFDDLNLATQVPPGGTRTESVWFLEPIDRKADPKMTDDARLAARTAAFGESRLQNGEFPVDGRAKALKHKKKMPPPPGPEGPPGPCAWVQLGPRNINGRVSAIAIHPSDGSRVFAGTANAGVWATKDSGISWTPLMFQEGALEIGALALNLTNPAQPNGDVTIYAATGESRWFPGYKGVGVLKSTTSGSPGSWQPTGNIPSPGGDRFSSIVVDSSTVTVDPTKTTVWAGGPNGLFKTTNGGGSWNEVKIQNVTKNIQSIALDPQNPSIVYVGVANEGIYKFNPTNSTWGTFNTGIGSFPGLVAIDICESAPYTMYAKLDQNVYVYDTINSTWNSLGNHGGTTYGYWNNVIAVDPLDATIVFAGGISFERTHDGGAFWSSAGGGILHSDQHALVFDSSNHLNVYLGNDGGIFRGTHSSASDPGTYVKRSNGLTISHLNMLGSSPAAPDLIGSGLQDNGVVRTTGGLTWQSVADNDGAVLLFDPANPLDQYLLTNSSVPYKAADGKTFNPAGSGFPGAPFIGTMILDPNSPAEPNRALFASGGSAVYRSANSAGSWSQSTPTGVGGQGLSALFGAAIAVSPSSSAVVYAGSNGSIWRSSDGGATQANWKNITVGNLGGSATLPSRGVGKIVVHPTNPDTIYVAFQGFNGGTPGHVFRGTSTDGWNTWGWTDLSSNLPDIPANALEINRATPTTLWVGTDVGVFQTTNEGGQWTNFGNGLPNVVISDLSLNAAGDTLRAAAYGYGAWEIHLAQQCEQQDLYVRDNKLDTGEGAAQSDVQDPTDAGQRVYWWESPDVKVDTYPYQTAPADGVDFDQFADQNPVRNDANHPNANKLYIQVHNRGPQPTNNVKVKVLWADATAGLPALPSDFWTTFPNAWTAASTWSPVDANVPFQSIPQLFPHTPAILTWSWTVPTTAAQHTCMLVVVSSDEDPVTRSDANGNDHLVWMVAPNDKHVALRNLTIVTGPVPPPPPGSPGPGPGSGRRAPKRWPLLPEIRFYNPASYPQLFDLAFDPGSLPRGSQVSVLLPKLAGPAVGSRKRVKGAKRWWRERLPKGDFHEEWELPRHHGPAYGRQPALIAAGVLIPAGKAVTAAVAIAPPVKAPPGAVYRCALLQREQGRLVGGNTFEVRVPPRDMVVRW